MSQWPPHITVACVIERDGNYLMVEERDKTSGELVFNQPAGHLEQGESITDAALRETLEETGWRVELIGVIGIALHRAAKNGITYYRTTFLARPLQQVPNAVIDPDIHAVHWLDYEAILARSARMRSPLALAVVERHRQGVCYPLDLILKP
jgi:ADP-ribose pyrophosphatase YjhB (NUDIX family)